MAYRQILLIGVLICSLKFVTAEICTYTRTSDTKPTGDGNFKLGINTIDDCEAACTPDSMCAATQFKNSACFTSTQTRTELDLGSTHSLKSCSPAATTTVELTSSTVEPTSSTVEPTSSTVEPTSSTVKPTSSTVEPTSSTVGPTISTSKGVCVMLKSEGTRGDTDFKVKILLTGSSCLYLCQLTDACRAITYDKTSCSLYSKDTSTRSLLGSNHVTRMFCVDGTECCWLNVSQTSGGSDHYATITNSLTSCENICLKYLTCTDVYWDGEYCYIYTTQTTTSSQTGSAYSKKSCTQGAEQGLYKFNSLCSGSSVSRMCVNSSLVIFIAVFVDYYIKRYL